MHAPLITPNFSDSWVSAIHELSAQTEYFTSDTVWDTLGIIQPSGQAEA